MREIDNKSLAIMQLQNFNPKFFIIIKKNITTNDVLSNESNNL